MVSETETFNLTGPSFLTDVDWNNSYHRRSIAASLVQGVYVLEHDRRQNRQGPQALAPPWWEFFNFRLIHILVDDHDVSNFGVIYEYNFSCPYPKHLGQSPPQYVLAFRGTINEPGNRAEDFKLDLHVMINNLQDSRRFQIGLHFAMDLVSRAGPGNVWVAGHSLGSSIALLVGRQMAKMTTHLETYLFNPPFISPPFERINNEKVKLGLRFANSVVTAGLAMAANGVHGSKDKENESFATLSSWIPYLFLNPNDMICSEYIGYFEHREKMEAIGAGKIGRLATKYSIGSIVSSARGKDSEAAHLIPSAYLTINSSPSQNFRVAHGVEQWWTQNLEFKYKLYLYE